MSVSGRLFAARGTGGRLIVKKQVHNGVTVAVAEKTGGE